MVDEPRIDDLILHEVRKLRSDLGEMSGRLDEVAKSPGALDIVGGLSLVQMRILGKLDQIERDLQTRDRLERLAKL